MSMFVFNTGHGNLRWPAQHDIEVLRLARQTPRPTGKNIQDHLFLKFGVERTVCAIDHRIKVLTRGKKSAEEALRKLERRYAIEHPEPSAVNDDDNIEERVRPPQQAGRRWSKDDDRALIEARKSMPDASVSELTQRINARVGVMFRSVASVQMRCSTLLGADQSWLNKAQLNGQPQVASHWIIEPEIEPRNYLWTFDKSRALLEMLEQHPQYQWAEICGMLQRRFPDVDKLFHKSQVRAKRDRLMKGHETTRQALEALYKKTFEKCGKDRPWMRQEMVLLIGMWLSTPTPSPREIIESLGKLRTNPNGRVKRRTIDAVEFQFNLFQAQAQTRPEMNIFEFFRVGDHEIQLVFSRAGLTVPNDVLTCCVRKPQNEPWSSVLWPDMRIWRKEEGLDLLRLYNEKPCPSHADVAERLSSIHARVDQPSFTASSCKSTKRYLVDQRGKTIEKAIADLENYKTPILKSGLSTWTLQETIMVLEMYTREPKPSWSQLCDSLLAVRSRRRHESVVRRHVQYLIMLNRESPEALHARLLAMLPAGIDPIWFPSQDTEKGTSISSGSLTKEGVAAETRPSSSQDKLVSDDFSDSEGPWDPLSDASDSDDGTEHHGRPAEHGIFRSHQLNGVGNENGPATVLGVEAGLRAELNVPSSSNCNVTESGSRATVNGMIDWSARDDRDLFTLLRDYLDNDTSEAETIIQSPVVRRNGTPDRGSSDTEPSNKENIHPGIHSDVSGTTEISFWEPKEDDDEDRHWFHLDDDDDSFYDADSEEEGSVECPPPSHNPVDATR